MSSRALVALIALSALVCGCRTLPAPSTTAALSWEERRVQLQGRDHFQISGRVAVAAAQEGFTAQLHWVQAGTQSRLALDGPLGVGGLRVIADGTALSVVNARGERLDSEAASTDLRTHLGFDAPLASLRFWILGVPNPASPAVEVVDVAQRLTSLQQDDWQIEYADYVAVKGEWLPGRMTLRRADVRVRLIVDHWDSLSS
jgi:outer membrane lipoprotein LolB